MQQVHEMRPVSELRLELFALVNDVSRSEGHQQSNKRDYLSVL